MTTADWVMVGIGAALLAFGFGVIRYAKNMKPGDVP